RCARGCSQTALGTKVIDFDDHTIHLKFGIVAMICPVLDLVLDFLRCRDPLRIRRNRKAPRRNGSVGIVLARGSKAFTSTETMCYQTQTTLFHIIWVFHPQATSSRISRIRESLLAFR